jgi:DNA-binding SARP family transcriptional activator
MNTMIAADQPLQVAATNPTTITLVCLLGNFRVVHQGRPLKLLNSGKTMTLLAELALRLEDGMAREELLETLWPEQDPSNATVSLNSLIYSLQRRMRNAGQETPVLYVNGHYALNTASGVSTDVACFDDDIRRAGRLAAAGKEVAATRLFEHAVGLYRGDLRVGTNVYSIIERERLRASYLSTLAWLADRAYQVGDDETALTHALRLLRGDPCREDAHRVVMRIRVHRGERSEALRQYRICEEILRREFDATPEAVTTMLYDQIRTGDTLL